MKVVLSIISKCMACNSILLLSRWYLRQHWWSHWSHLVMFMQLLSATSLYRSQQKLVKTTVSYWVAGTSAHDQVANLNLPWLEGNVVWSWTKTLHQLQLHELNIDHTYKYMLLLVIVLYTLRLVSDRAVYESKICFGMGLKLSDSFKWSKMSIGL